jgi:lipopolysaccharide export system protein LptA
MRKLLALSLGLTILFEFARLASAGTPPQLTTFRSFSVQGQSVQGDLRGPWEWTGGVVVTGAGLTMSCDSLKVWLTPDGRDAERIEASGNVRVQGRYLAADKTQWDIDGRAAAASYERKASQGILRGAVSFRATNKSTGAVLMAEAEKLVYDTTTQRFRFERGDQPVRMEWQEPEPAPAAEPAPEQEGS